VNVTIREDDYTYYATLDTQPDIEGVGETMADALRSLADELDGNV